MKKIISLLLFFICINSYSQQQNGIIIGTTLSTISYSNNDSLFFNANNSNNYGWVPGFYIEFKSKMKTSYKDLFFNPSIGVKQSGYVRDMYNNEWGWDTSQSANKAKFKKTQLELNFDIEYNLNKYLKGLSSIFGIGFDFTLFQQTKYPGTDIEVQTSGSLGSMGLGNRISSNLDLGINYNLGLASLELKYELFILDFNFSKISSSSSAIRPHLIKIGLLYFIDY